MHHTKLVRAIESYPGGQEALRERIMSYGHSFNSTFISNVKAGRKRIPPYMLVAFSEVLGIPMDLLVREAYSQN